MNFIISSIILLIIIIIIIYILSIDNNFHKIKNKMKELFSVLKSKNINYINEYDTHILLNFLKSHYKYGNIMIPKKIYYVKENDYYIMKNVEIICHNVVTSDNINNVEKLTINIKFHVIKNELFIGNYTLFGLNGNYYIENIEQNIKENIKENITNTIKDTIKEDKINNMNTSIRSSDLIPDIINISSNIDEDSVNITTISIS